ncbi:hypothetical protein K469DRAFT_631435 [Zopfia rhizophila CBS 207.26]|uniref:Protein kinase domain-containing protein n=1 Tax=Zopfia rhizophila CBS 207.26 TaxID=1314779 RepID=A0A6A6E256_9PEZI|nr:hypothetical protein K469DRAFT_631435 [Zopfia rhizophila CBS 207.26]
MEPVSLSFAVVAAFKDAYLTAKFIRNTAHSIKHFRGEQSSLVTRLNVQILRLKNFSRIFCGVNGNDVDMSLLETVPNQYLQTVRDIFAELQQVLASYTTLAASIDPEYQKYSPTSPHFRLDLSKVILQIDDAPLAEELEADGDDMNGNHNGNTSEAKRKSWFFFGRSSGSSKTKNRLSKGLPSVKSLPPSVQWLFTKDELEDTLGKFKEWNNELQHLIAPLLAGFGYYENKKLQERLQPDGEENIFEGHLELHKLSEEKEGGPKGKGSCQDYLIPWKEAELKMSQPRVLVEYKQIGNPLNQDEKRAETSSMSRPESELYAPQLANLLRTAGKHSFHTLPFNAYAWDVEKFQYAFLFDYPSDAGVREPQSLHDCILSGEPQFKLELKQRFHVAQTVVRAIGAFHSDGWVHKSVRSHAVKFFFGKDGKMCDFNNPYLTDFEFSRPDGGKTRLVARAVDVEHDVYRHPERYGQKPSANFRRIHDIYSLGVVLLEIGLWQTAKQIHDEIILYNLGGNSPVGGLPAKMIKEAFLQDASTRLAHRMGSSYQEAVISCLNEDWDEYVDRREFASEFQNRVVQKVDIKAFVG